MNEPTDEALMIRYVETGDRVAFEALFSRHGPRLYGTFRRTVGSDAIAQDLVQQTFLHLHRARRDYQHDRAFRPWLYAIAMNVRREHFRRLQRRPEQSFDPERHPEPRVAPEVSSASDRAVRRALGELPEHQREVVVLHWYEGLSFKEIASAVGASHSAVKVRAHRAYTQLRALLGSAE